MLSMIMGAVLALLIEHLLKKRSTLNLRLRKVHGRRPAMGVIDRPGIELVDVEKAELSIAPKDADGRIVTEGPYEWAIIDQVAAPNESGDVLTLEVAEDKMSAMAISGVPGTCIVTVLDTDDDVMERMPITVKYGKPSELNLSAGAPMPE